MSGYMKGTRKPKNAPGYYGVNIAGRFVPTEVVMVSMMSAIYLLFLVGGSIEKSLDAILLKVLSFVMFAFFALMFRSKLKRMKMFSGVADAFVGLSALPVLLDLLPMLGLFNVLQLHGQFQYVLTGLAFAILSFALLVSILYLEKEKLSSLYIGVKNTATGLATGAAGLVSGLVISLAAIFMTVQGAVASPSGVIVMVVYLLIFSLTFAVAVEAWFRGLLLSKLLPILEKDKALIVQAVIFGFFEAMFAYMLTSQLLMIPVVLITCAVLGHYWGNLTIKNKSLAGPALFHAGVYMLIALPAFLTWV